MLRPGLLTAAILLSALAHPTSALAGDATEPATQPVGKNGIDVLDIVLKATQAPTLQEFLSLPIKEDWEPGTGCAPPTQVTSAPPTGSIACFITGQSTPKLIETIAERIKSRGWVPVRGWMEVPDWRPWSPDPTAADDVFFEARDPTPSVYRRILVHRTARGSTTINVWFSSEGRILERLSNTRSTQSVVESPDNPTASDSTVPQAVITSACQPLTNASSCAPAKERAEYASNPERNEVRAKALAELEEALQNRRITPEEYSEVLKRLRSVDAGNKD